MKLGPLQEKWVETLEKYPEKQGRHLLGKIQEDGTIKLCCLGQGLLCLLESKGQSPLFKDNVLYNIQGSCYSLDYATTNSLGLYDYKGCIMSLTLDRYTSLASANDGGVTWPEIAAFIRANPEAVFNKSI
jgi:hypothetical protein